MQTKLPLNICDECLDAFWFDEIKRLPKQMNKKSVLLQNDTFTLFPKRVTFWNSNLNRNRELSDLKAGPDVLVMS